jgi:hypothetical protein
LKPDASHSARSFDGWRDSGHCGTGQF